MKDRLSQLVFEDEDLAADRGLRDVEFFAGRRERARFSDGADDVQLPQGHESVNLLPAIALREGEGRIQRGSRTFNRLVQIPFIHLDADEAEAELGAGARRGSETPQK